MSDIGYSRVSTADQHAESQADALTAAGVKRVFTDHGVSGVKASRPALDECLAYLRPGDTLVITRLDRLGRSLANLIELVTRLDQRGINLRVLEQGLDTSTATGKLMFHVIGAMAEFEHDLMTERTREGLAAAKARGRMGGRKVSYTSEQQARARALKEQGQLTSAEIGRAVGVSRATVYRMTEVPAG